MGMLTDAKKKANDAEAKKPDPKHKKHKAHASPDPVAPPGGSGEDAGADVASQPDDSADETAPQSGGSAGADDDSAQPGQAPAQDSPDQGDQGGEDQESQADGGAEPTGQGDGQEGGGAQDEDPSAAGGDQDDTSGDSSSQGQPVDLSKLPISPALREEFMRCNAALYTALYKNDKVASAVMSGIVPSGPHKVESAARMATLLVVQINKQLHFIQDTPQVVMPFTQDVVTHVLDLAQQVKKIQFTEQEAHAVLGTAQEIIMHTVGVTKKQMQALQHALPRSQIMDGLDKYKQHLQFIKGVQGPNSPDQGAQGGAPPAQGAPPGGQPQQGAPVTAAPGPGQSAPPGGMLTQAAAPPQGG